MSAGFVRALVLPVSVLLLAGMPRNSREAHGSPAAGVPVREVVIQGKVTDANTTQPLAGALVAVGNSSLRTSSDQQGRYRLVIPERAPRDTSILVRVLRIGYNPVSRTVPLSADSITVDRKSVV